MQEFYTANRTKFAEQMGERTMLVAFAGYAPVRRGDQFYPYAPQRNFLYLTGIDRPGMALIMIKNNKGEVNTRLFLERYDELTAKWDGAVLDKEKAKALSGIEHFAYLDELDRHIVTGFLRDMIHTVYIDMENRSFSAPNTPELDFVARLREKFPAITPVNARPMFAKQRVIKADWEIENLRRAAQITGEGFNAVMSSARPGMAEYELEAHLDYTYKKNGACAAFNTIMAAGKNATILHYNENNNTIGENDLVLLDFGAAWRHYCADVSRTIPASGRFTDRQRQLYNIVLGGLKLVTNMVKPGVVFNTFNEKLKEYYVEELSKIGLIKDKDELVKYYYHNVSHMLGLEVHDISLGGEIEIQPGMVFTIEPGLYIAEESIGIRIEDDVLVTEDGCEVLTSQIPREPDEIEAFMAKCK